MKGELFIFYILIMFLVTACSNEDNMSHMNYEERIINSISVSMASRADDNEDSQGESEEGEDEEDTVPGFMLDPYEMPFTLEFDKNSIIFLSQQTPQTVPFKTPDAIYPYRYKEEYDEIADPENDWYDDNIYNFTPISDNPLEWFKIANTGSYISGFYLYALYFPLQEEISQREDNGNILYHVQKDQSLLENLIKSDIMGAFHSSPTLFSRLSFRLFHLMTYIGIRLYVPVYDQQTKTGYYDNSLVSASLENVTPEFAIQWTHQISPDTQGPQIKPLKGREQIKMYLHPLEESTIRPIVDIDYESFLPSGFFEQPLPGNVDQVRVYDFSVLMPKQEFTVQNDDNSSGQNYPDFLTFVLRSNSGAENVYYFNQSLIKDAEENELKLEQGVFQYLELYVPRVGNRFVYAGSHLQPWLHHSTSFPLQDDM